MLDTDEMSTMECKSPPNQQQGQQFKGRNRAENQAANRTGKWLLTSLQLLAVQPACLRSNYLQQVQAEDAVREPGAHHLLLHLQTGLGHAAAPSGSACTAASDNSLPDPAAGLAAEVPQFKNVMPLSAAVLKVVVLTSSMRELLQRQINLEQLLEQQQCDTDMSISSCASDTDRCLDASISPRAASNVHNSTQQSLFMNLSLSFPTQTNEGPLDALQLLLTVQQQGFERPVLVAAVPLLLMPAAAQQEVQQLLLPAMRQDAQSTLTAQQQQQQQQPCVSQDVCNSHMSAQTMQVEAIVWKHFSQLGLDILTVMQLSGIAGVPAAAALESAAYAAALPGQLEPAAVAAPADGSVSLSSPPYSNSTAVLEMITHTNAQAQPLAIAMEELATSLLFPCLLPFLAAHGLYNTTRLVLDCLPLHLQEQWRLQQLAQLQALVAVEDTCQQQQQQQLLTTLQNLSSSSRCSSRASSGSGSSDCQLLPSLPTEATTPGNPSARKDHSASQQVDCHSSSGSDQAGPPLTQGAAPASAAAAVPAVFWYHQVLAGFEDEVELRWGHRQLRHAAQLVVPPWCLLLAAAVVACCKAHQLPCLTCPAFRLQYV
jgi:hypothetical protein